MSKAINSTTYNRLAQWGLKPTPENVDLVDKCFDRNKARKVYTTLKELQGLLVVIGCADPEVLDQLIVFLINHNIKTLQTLKARINAYKELTDYLQSQGIPNLETLKTRIQKPETDLGGLVDVKKPPEGGCSGARDYVTGGEI